MGQQLGVFVLILARGRFWIRIRGFQFQQIFRVVKAQLNVCAVNVVIVVAVTIPLQLCVVGQDASASLLSFTSEREESAVEPSPAP